MSLRGRLITRSALRFVLVAAVLWQLCLLAAPAPVTAESTPYSLWDAASRPATAAESDTSAVELGVKFRSGVDGYVTGVRFYKGTTALGTYDGSLWSAQGTRLARATFSTSAGTGWQEVRFAAPVAVKAGTTYVAPYHTSVGRYAVDQGYFSGRSVTSGPLTALADGTAGGNGLYRYGASGFPVSSYRASNYVVDVLFETAVSGTIAATPTAAPATPTAATTSATTTPTPTPPPPTPTSSPSTPTATQRRADRSAAATPSWAPRR